MENYEYEYEVNGFEKNPILKKLMYNYVKYKEEENADLSDDGLKAYYFYLLKNNKLNVLFESEKRGVLEREKTIEEKLSNHYPS